jgi:hypothetical protein
MSAASGAEVGALFERIVSILEQARGAVVRHVNACSVAAYWLIGKEIVLAVQGGRERARYGKGVMLELSALLARRYGIGFSLSTLKNARQF